MSNLVAGCCCTQFDLYELYDCAETGPTVPRYMWARCDIYELETGQPRANCPADWTPNPHIVWVIERPGCDSDLDYACGKFIEISTLEQPAAMTTDAVNAGYQGNFEPDLPVVNTCQYCPTTPCLPILGGPNDILAWLTVEDCCTDECAGTNGDPLGCDLITANCGLPWSTVANAGVFDYDIGNGTYTDGLGTSVSTTITMLSVPSGWTISQDQNGSFGQYELTADFTFRVVMQGVLACVLPCSPCDDPSSSTTPISATANFTYRMRAICTVNSNTCNFGGNTTPLVSGFYTTTSPVTLPGGTYCEKTATAVEMYIIRVPQPDHLCNNGIYYGRTNLHRLTTQHPTQASFSLAVVGTCSGCPMGAGSGAAYVQFEAMTPLGEAADYGC